MMGLWAFGLWWWWREWKGDDEKRRKRKKSIKKRVKKVFSGLSHQPRSSHFGDISGVIADKVLGFGDISFLVDHWQSQNKVGSIDHDVRNVKKISNIYFFLFKDLSLTETPFKCATRLDIPRGGYISGEMPSKSFCLFEDPVVMIKTSCVLEEAVGTSRGDRGIRCRIFF